MALFNGERLECFHCHSGVNLTTSYRDIHTTPGDVRIPFFNTGLYNLSGATSYPQPNTGLHRHTGRAEDIG